MTASFHALFRAFFRALASMLHPRMWWLTMTPLLITAVVWGVGLYLGWETLLGWVQQGLEHFSLSQGLYRGLEWAGLGGLKIAIAPLILVALLMPLIVVSALWYISLAAMPTILKHLGTRHYAGLEKAVGGSLLGGLGNSLWCTVLFAVFTVLLLPVWLIPPFFALIPPLLWGWLTYRVMSYDALAEHASAAERKTLLKQHRLPLLVMGIVAGLMGSAPTFLGVSSVVLIVAFPFVALGALWVYMLIFVFSGLWFAHYCLHALQVLRAPQTPVSANPAPTAPSPLASEMRSLK